MFDKMSMMLVYIHTLNDQGESIWCQKHRDGWNWMVLSEDVINVIFFGCFLQRIFLYFWRLHLFCAQIAQFLVLFKLIFWGIVKASLHTYFICSQGQFFNWTNWYSFLVPSFHHANTSFYPLSFSLTVSFPLSISGWLPSPGRCGRLIYMQLWMSPAHSAFISHSASVFTQCVCVCVSVYVLEVHKHLLCPFLQR